MKNLIFIMIITLFCSSIFAKNEKGTDKTIPNSVLNELYNYSDNYFREVLKNRTLDLKDKYKKLIADKYIAGGDLTHSMIVKRTIIKCTIKHGCFLIKTDFLNYNANMDLFENLFKKVDDPHFLAFYLNKKTVKSHRAANITKMFSNGEYATFAKDNSKKSRISPTTGNILKLQNFGWLESNGKIITFSDNSNFKHYHKEKTGKYAIFTHIISNFTIFTHTRPVKEKLKKITIKFPNKHKETSANIVYKRLGPGFEQTDFEQTVKLKENTAKNPKEKFTTGHYNVSLKDAFCGCDYPLDENKILDTYDDKLEEQYEHNFKLDLVKGDITGGLIYPNGNNSPLKGNAVRLIPACKDGGLEKSRISLTNNDGKFVFPSIPKGVYKIKIGNKILGEVKHCKAKAKLTYVGKYKYNHNLYDLKLTHKMYSKKKYVGKLEMKLKEVDLEAYPFCESKYKDVVNVFPPSKKIPPYLDKSVTGFNYTFLTKLITNIKDVKYTDYSKTQKYMKCRVAKTGRNFSIKGTLKPLKVPTVGGILSKNSVYLDYSFSIECLHPKAKFWIPRWMIIARPTPKKFSKLYKFSKLDNKSIKNIWEKKAFEFKSPVYKVGTISQELTLKGEIHGDKCTNFFTSSECANAYKTEDNPNTKTSDINSQFECDEQKEREAKKNTSTQLNDKEKTEDPIPNE